MTLKNKNLWKYLSVGLLGVIAIGLLAPAQAAPGDALSGWQLAVADLQSQIDTTVGDFQGQIDDLVTDLATEVSRATAAEAGIASNLAAHELADGDLSDTNEIQSLSETDGVISLSGDGSVTVQDRVSSTCAAGSSIRAIAADGTVTCEADTDTNTTYTAGTGLVLTGTEFSADTNQLQKRVSSSCAVGSSIRAIAADGTVTCETIVQGGSLSLTIHQNTNDIPANSDTFAISICPSGVAVSGGYVDPDASPDILILQDNTSISSTAYVAQVHNFNNFEVKVTTFVRCLELVTPP